MFKKCDKYSSLVFLIHNVFLYKVKVLPDRTVKVSINKANPATDEARVENQSMVLRGLA